MKNRTERICIIVCMNISLFLFGIVVIAYFIPVGNPNPFNLHNIILCLGWSFYCIFKGWLEAMPTHKKW